MSDLSLYFEPKLSQILRKAESKSIVDPKKMTEGGCRHGTTNPAPGAGGAGASSSAGVGGHHNTAWSNGGEQSNGNHHYSTQSGAHHHNNHNHHHQQHSSHRYHRSHSRGRSPSTLSASASSGHSTSTYEQKKNMRWILSLGLLLPALAAIIGMYQTPYDPSWGLWGRKLCLRSSILT